MDSAAPAGQEKPERRAWPKGNYITLRFGFNYYRLIYFMDSRELSSILESLLFVAGRPLRAKDFAKLLELEEKEVEEQLSKMVDERANFGIVLLQNGKEYELATNAKNSTHVKNFLNAELREKLTDATVEVLAIIAYRQPISKAEIEAIRGVNSQYSLRNLLMRGLIEKISNPNDARSFLYQTTTEFLMHLGLKSVKDLPEFEKLVEQIKLPQTPGLEQQASGEDKPADANVEPIDQQQSDDSILGANPLPENPEEKSADPT